MQIRSAQIKDARFAQDVRNLAYIADATSYHCNQLIERYLDALDFNSRYVPRNCSEDFISSGHAHYFEFEALVTTVVRAMEHLQVRDSRIAEEL